MGKSFMKMINSIVKDRVNYKELAVLQDTVQSGVNNQAISRPGKLVKVRWFLKNTSE